VNTTVSLRPMLYTIISQDGYLNDRDNSGKKWIYIWDDIELAEALIPQFPECEVVELNIADNLSMLKVLRERGLSHIWGGKGGKNDGALIGINDALTYLHSLLYNPQDPLPNQTISKSPSIKSVYRVNPANFIEGSPSFVEFIESVQSGGSPEEQIILSTLKSKSRIAKIMAEDLGMPISETDAITIAQISLYPGDTSAPVPLTPYLRNVAEEILFHAWTAYNRSNDIYSDAREMAKQSVAAGERETEQY